MKIKPKINLPHVIVTAYRIWSQKHCPKCLSKSPYYSDCPICEGYVIGCNLAPQMDIFIKYLVWLKEE